MAADDPDHIGAVPPPQSEIPPRAVLARRWPKLHVNRMTWRWRDDATGARGDDAASLVSYLGEARR